MARVRFGILGPLQIRRDARPLSLAGGRQHALLALFVIHANEVLSTDRLVEELWGEPTPPHAGKRMQVAIARRRNALMDGGEHDEAARRTVAGGHVLTAAPGDLDADAFVAGVDDGRGALDEGDAQRAAEQLRDALSFVRGPPLPEVAHEAFARHIARPGEIRLVALEARVDADLKLGRDAALMVEPEALVAEYPLRARLRYQLTGRSTPRAAGPRRSGATSARPWLWRQIWASNRVRRSRSSIRRSSPTTLPCG